MRVDEVNRPFSLQPSYSSEQTGIEQSPRTRESEVPRYLRVPDPGGWS